MRRALALAVVVLGVLAPTATAATTLNIIPHGQCEPGVSWAGLPGHAARRDAGADVRPPHAALPRRDRRAARPERRRHRLLQVGRAGRRERPVAHHQRHRRGHRPRRRRGERARQARRLRRAAHLQRYGRGRDLRRRLRHGAGPQPAARPGARQRRRRAHRHARRAGHPARAGALHLQADQEGPRRGDRAADQVDRGAGRPGAPAAERHRRLPGGHQPLVLAEQPDDGAVHADRHLRPERAQVAVPGPGRRPGGRQRLVPRRRALQARRDPRRRGLRGPARALRPRDRDHDDAQLPRPDQGQRGQAARHGAHRQRQLPLDRAQAPGLDARGGGAGGHGRPSASGRRSWPATSSSRAGRRRRRARRSSWAARRSATTTPA